MAKGEKNLFPFPPPRVYLGAKIPRQVIRRYADAVAAEFHPDKIVLFGSHAYGTPKEESDVDLLVIMPASNQHAQAVRIQYQLTAPFPIDLILRTPEQVRRRLAEGESFLTTILSQGKVLYEKDHTRLGQKGGSGLRTRRHRQSKQRARS